MTKLILPLNNFIGNSEGENVVWRKFLDFLPTNFVSFHNYHLGLKQADIILLVPKRGILVIEIKGFLAKNIIDVPDRTIIRMKNQPASPSPFDQVIKYRNILINEFLKPNNIESVYVTCGVCYPFVTREEYHSTGLDKISHSILTITLEDLLSQETLLEKIDDIFNHTYESVAMPNLIKFGFENELIEEVGNVISPNFRNAFTTKDTYDNTQINVIKRDLYSRFIYTKNADEFSDDKIDELISQWSTGTKIYLYTADVLLLKKVSEKLKATLNDKELTSRKAFGLQNYTTFLFSAGIAPALSEDFEIINGVNYSDYLKEFTQLHRDSTFNKDQYEIEHASLENIIIKAGAGTGKTYSMISRINYLVWKNDYDAEDMKKAIAMITFTNESADVMKEKLSDNFLNYYLLSKDIVFLSFVESVEDMNISTIHSMAKKILQKYAAKIGMGKDFSIITGNFKRSQLLHNKLNEFIVNNPDFAQNIDISMFLLGERLKSFLDKLDNKNVDIVSDIEALNFGNPTNEAFNQLIEVIRATQSEMSEYCQLNNSVSLGDLIRKLRTLYKVLKVKGTTVDDKIDFLFVDEFQDTDDIQINLIKSFKDIFNFKLFVVGDIKQCIYRFRGAEVKAFDTLAKGFEEPMMTISLNKNYRTDVQLLGKLNEVFIKWNTNKNIEYAGEDILSGTKHYCDKDELYNLDYCSEEMFEKKLVASINRLKTQLENENDKIAVLVRYNWQISEIREICERNKINIETEIGGELFKIDPTIDLFKLILSLKFNKSPKYIFNLYTTSYVIENMPKIDIWNKKENEIVDYFYSNLPLSLSKWNDYISRLRTEPVLKVIRDIVEESRPWETFSKKINASGDDIDRSESYYIRNLDQLFEKLILASNTDYLTINKLSDYLEIMILTRREEEARESYDLEKSTAKVICTTVHKSKGLEFDTLILPYCNFDVSCSTPKGDVDLIYSDNEIGYKVLGRDYKVAFENDLYKKFRQNEVLDRKYEESRILYVALTRAIRKIVFFTDKTPTTRKHTNCWSNMIKEA